MANEKVFIAIREEDVAFVLEGLESLKESIAGNCHVPKGCEECQTKWMKVNALIKGILASSPEVEYVKE